MSTTDAGFTTNYKKVSVSLVDGAILDGKVNIAPHERLSDFMNSQNRGFVLVVESSPATETNKTTFINKSKVKWVEPDD